MNTANASNTISESDYGIHTLVVYEDLVILREFYSQYVKKGIEERNEVIQLAPFYETEDSVRKILSEGSTSIDIEKWEKAEESLIIVDSLKKYTVTYLQSLIIIITKIWWSMLRRWENPVYQS